MRVRHRLGGAYWVVLAMALFGACSDYPQLPGSEQNNGGETGGGTGGTGGGTGDYCQMNCRYQVWPVLQEAPDYYRCSQEGCSYTWDCSCAGESRSYDATLVTCERLVAEACGITESELEQDWCSATYPYQPAGAVCWPQGAGIGQWVCRCADSADPVRIGTSEAPITGCRTALHQACARPCSDDRGACEPGATDGSYECTCAHDGEVRSVDRVACEGALEYCEPPCADELGSCALTASLGEYDCTCTDGSAAQPVYALDCEQALGVCEPGCTSELGSCAAGPQQNVDEYTCSCAAYAPQRTVSGADTCDEALVGACDPTSNGLIYGCNSPYGFCDGPSDPLLEEISCVCADGRGAPDFADCPIEPDPEHDDCDFFEQCPEWVMLACAPPDCVGELGVRSCSCQASPGGVPGVYLCLCTDEEFGSWSLKYTVETCEEALQRALVDV